MTVVAEADSSESIDFKLPQTRVPEPIIKGMRGWKTGEGYLVLRTHYSCDPDRADSEWVSETSQGYPGGVDGPMWQREMEIDFGSYAGLPVYPKFDKTNSVRPVKYNPSIPLWRGWDFGYRNPAVVFLQLWPDDTLVFLHEIFPTLDKEDLPGISTSDLAKLVLDTTNRLFPQASDSNLSAGVYDFCDPAGVQTKETSDYSSVEILQQHGIWPEYNVVGRKSRVEYSRVYVEGFRDTGDGLTSPKFLINPHCSLAIEAFAAAYRYPEDDKGGADREMPDSTSKRVQAEPYIHLIDAFEYVVACNLEITHQTKTGFTVTPDDRRLVDDLAAIYLGATEDRPSNRHTGKTDVTDIEDLEESIYDVIGEPSLEDAFSVY